MERDDAAERARIENDMIQMVQGMKQFASGFKEQFKKDEGAIKDVNSL